MKNRKLFTGILIVIIGVIFIFWPSTTLNAFCRLMGWCLIIGGAFEILTGVVGDTEVPIIIGGAAAVIAGLVFVVRPDLIISFLPTVVGFCMAFGGAVLFIQAIVQKNYGPAGIMTIIGSGISVIAGIILMINAYSAVKLLTVVLGLFLIYFGLLLILKDVRK